MAATSQQFDVGAVGSDDYLSALTRRLEALEKRVIGQDGIRPDQPPLKPTLEVSAGHGVLILDHPRTQMLENKLAQGFSKVGAVSSLWSKMAALEKALDPTYLSNLKLTDSAKTDLLIGYTAQLTDLSKPIEELQRLKDYLNVTEFQGLEEHEKKLLSVAILHSQQERLVEQLTGQVHQLLSAYSRIMLQLSAQLVEWGEAAKNKQ